LKVELSAAENERKETNHRMAELEREVTILSQEA